MHFVEIRDGFGCFIFPEIEGFDYGFSIYALQSRGSVLLMDTAFRSQIRQVKSFLEARGLEITHAVISHFHNDHVAGLTTLPGTVKVLGSPLYGKTLARDIPQKVIPVPFKEPFRFGSFTLNFIPSPGHSPCSILTDIDGEFLHVGDNIMGRFDGRRILPWVERDQIGEHIKALEDLKAMGRGNILLSHGPMIEEAEEAAGEIDLRLHYLREIMKSTGGVGLEEVLPDNRADWVSPDHFFRLMEDSSERK